MSLRVMIDPERCQGHGRCYDVCPDVFVPDAEGFATVVDVDIVDGSELAALARRAQESCPERAIAIEH
jgi:ferredoxin